MEDQKDEGAKHAELLQKFIYNAKYLTKDRDDEGRGVARGKLKKGLEIAGKKHFEFEMVEASTGDMFDAEAEVPVANALAYNGALMMLQLRKIGTFAGPFTTDMIRKLHPVDFNILRTAQTELDVLGEAE